MSWTFSIITEKTYEVTITKISRLFVDFPHYHTSEVQSISKKITMRSWSNCWTLNTAI